ncbi:hypothetical protein PMAYCL1PPCAC_16685, partial [Pristionchus mayeri]
SIMPAVLAAKTCLVCGAPTIYSHFGIDSCRACAEFYKRTVSTSKKLACRQGSRKCKISKSERFMCRRCRYEKCKDLGMTLEDPRKKKMSQMLTGVEPGPSSSPYQPSPPVTPGESILRRITNAHNAAVSLRKREEFSSRPFSLRDHIRVEHNIEDLELCSWSFLMDCLKMYASDYFQYAESAFPEHTQLTIEEKFLMLQSCAVRVYLLEAAIFTLQTFGSLEGPMYMVTLTSCVDRDNLKFLIQDANPSARHADIVKSLAYCLDRLTGIVGPALGKMSLTEMEIHALLGLAHWQIDPSHAVPERLLQMAEKIRKEIYADLRRYYVEELHLEDFSVRMGNLMTLEHIIQEGNALMAEDIQTYNLLDMLHADAAFLQIVLQIKL